VYETQSFNLWEEHRLRAFEKNSAEENACNYERGSNRRMKIKVKVKI
jgi:hypothetical protein